MHYITPALFYCQTRQSVLLYIDIIMQSLRGRATAPAPHIFGEVAAVAELCEPCVQREVLCGGTAVYVNATHRVNTDAMLLSHFCRIHRADRACDLGSGCGIIPLRWHDAGHRGPALAVELQPDAAALLEKSLAETDPFTGECPGQHITALCADLRTLQRRDVPFAGRYDLVCCNPPYFTGGAVSPKPGRAEARHQLTCTTADVARAAAMLLKDGGRLCLCGRPSALAQVMADCVNTGLQPKRLRFVRHRPDAACAASLFLLDCRKAGGVGLILEPDLLMEDGAGNVSAEVQKIYNLET